MNAASAGKWAAVALFSFVAVLIVIAAATELSRRENGEREAGGPDPFDVATPAFVPEARWVDPGEIADETGVLAGGEEWTWSQVDASGRVEYEITAARVDPEEGGRIVLTEPRATIYLGEDVVRVRAAEGELVKPPESEPESGWLGGGIVIEIFEGVVGADGEVDLEGRRASATLRTESLRFETALGQVETDDAIEFESEGVSFAGRGLLVRVGELERGRRYRLNVLRIEESMGLRVRPGAFAGGEDDGGEEGAGARGGASAEAMTGDEAAAVDFYRASMEGDVEVSQGARRISAERLVVFARLIGGELAEGAIREIALPEEEGAGRARGGEAAWSESFAGAGEEADEGGVIDAEEEIVLRWSGPLQIRPEQIEPPELAREEVLVRFASPRRNVVELTDGESGASARCAALMYGLTSARLVMAGVGPAELGVRLEAPGLGEVLGDDLRVELGALPRGVVRMGSGGRARLEDRDEVEGAAVSWDDSAEIGFEAVRVDGRVEVLARSVTMQGGVRGREGGNRVEAGFVQAEFRDRDGSEGDRESALTRLFLSGAVRAETEDGGRLVADEAEVEFGGEGRAPEPVSARASGGVRVEREGRWLRAEHLDAQFAADGRGRVRVTRVDADTGVSMGTDRGFGATTERLRADLENETYELTGDTTELFHEERGARYGLRGSAMRIDGRTRRLISFGRGEATYRLAGSSGAGAVEDSGRIEWAGGMYYDDLAGTAEMLGKVVASRVPGPLERQHAEAGQVRISITPWSTEGEAGEARRLLGIDLEGSQEEPALLELRRYRGGGEDVELETLVALRSDVVRFDAVGEVLRVPRDGLLLVEDRRVVEGDRVVEREGMDEGDVRGTTAFEWEEGLEFVRPTGEAEMRRNVRVRHMGLETGRLTQLECESLSARFRRPEEEVAGASPLLGVEAREAVYLRHGTIEVICDALSFDALEEEVEASAHAGNRVTVLDSADSRHFTAREIVVDLRTGQWRAREAAGIRVGD